MPLAANATAVSKDECREFMSVFPGNLLLTFTKKKFDAKNSKKRIENILLFVFKCLLEYL